MLIVSIMSLFLPFPLWKNLSHLHRCENLEILGKEKKGALVSLYISFSVFFVISLYNTWL